MPVSMTIPEMKTSDAKLHTNIKIIPFRTLVFFFKCFCIVVSFSVGLKTNSDFIYLEGFLDELHFVLLPSTRSHGKDTHGEILSFTFWDRTMGLLATHRWDGIRGLEVRWVKRGVVVVKNPRHEARSTILLAITLLLLLLGGVSWFFGIKDRHM